MTARAGLGIIVLAALLSAPAARSQTDLATTSCASCDARHQNLAKRKKPAADLAVPFPVADPCAPPGGATDRLSTPADCLRPVPGAADPPQP